MYTKKQLVRLLRCVLTAYPISTHNALFAARPCLSCALSFYVQNLLLVSARLHAP